MVASITFLIVSTNIQITWIVSSGNFIIFGDLSKIVFPNEPMICWKKLLTSQVLRHLKILDISGMIICYRSTQMYYLHQCWLLDMVHFMMTSWNINIFRVTDPLWRESVGHRWIPLIKASDVELWRFLWSAPEQTVEKTIATLDVSSVFICVKTEINWTN